MFHNDEISGRRENLLSGLKALKQTGKPSMKTLRVLEGLPSRRFGRDVLVIILVAVVGGFVPGCGNTEDDDKSKKELVILCGSSFVPAMEELRKEFTAETGIAAVTTVAGSEDFLPLVKAGQMGDILITHDPYLAYVRDAGALSGHVHVGLVAPVLAVWKGNPKKIKSIENLGRPGLRVALSNPQYSTCGEMVFKLLEDKGIKEKVLKNVENRLTKGHANLGTLIKTEAVDAVIMWNGVANTFRNSLDVVPTPYEYDTEIGVHVIGLNYSKYPESVKCFLEFTRRKGKSIFARHGYTK